MRSHLDRIVGWEQRARNARYCVHRLALSVDATPRQLERYFFDGRGVSPKVWLDELRMKDAVRLMRAGRSLKEIAVKVGFAHSQSFTRSFERVKRLAPTEFLAARLVPFPRDVAKSEEMSQKAK